MSVFFFVVSLMLSSLCVVQGLRERYLFSLVYDSSAVIMSLLFILVSLDISIAYNSVLNRLGDIKNSHLDVGSYILLVYSLVSVFVWIIYRKKSPSRRSSMGFRRFVSPHRAENINKPAVAPILLGVGVVSIICSISYFGSITVFNAPYPQNQKDMFFPNIVLNLLSVYSVYLICKVYFSIKNFFISFIINLYLVLVLYLGILVVLGSRGVLFFFALLLSLVFVREFIIRRSFSSIFYVILFGVIALFLFFVWPYMRGYLYAYPFFQSLVEIVSRIVSAFKNSYFDFIPMFSQSVFHVLYVADLSVSGALKSYGDITDLFVVQIPSFFDGLFYDRPISDAEYIQNLYANGGGLFFAANAWLYGGISGALTILIFVVFVARFIDIRLSGSDGFIQAGYYLSVGIFSIALFYGLQALLRGVELGLIIVLCQKIIHKKSLGIK